MSKTQSKPNHDIHAGSMGQLNADELNKLSERSKYAYDLVNSWIGNNDNKVSVSCAVLTGAFGVISFLSERAFTNTVPSSASTFCIWVHSISFYLSLVLMTIAIFLFCCALIPKLESTSGKKSKKYPIFFGDIALTKVEDYKKMVLKSSDADFISELSLETHANSKICLTKMKKYRAGMITSLFAIIFSIISYVARTMM